MGGPSMKLARGKQADKFKRTGISHKAFKEHMTAYSMIFPAMFFFFLFLVIPIFKALQMSFYDYSGIGPLEDFIGLGNYAASVADADLYGAIYNTLKLVVLDVLISTLVGFFLAYLLFVRIRAWKFYSVALYIPAIVPVAVAGLIWRQIYEPTQGLLNSILGSMGLDSLKGMWLGSMDLAMGSVIASWVWRVIPFIMLILYSGMLRIPEELFESARIDGAKEMDILRKIVLPYMMPVISILVIYVIATDFRAFDMVWVLTQGGPGNVTQIATVYVYKLAVSFYQYGYANAVGIEIFFIVGGLVYLFVMLMKKLGLSDDSI